MSRHFMASINLRVPHSPPSPDVIKMLANAQWVLITPLMASQSNERAISIISVWSLALCSNKHRSSEAAIMRREKEERGSEIESCKFSGAQGVSMILKTWF